MLQQQQELAGWVSAGLFAAALQLETGRALGMCLTNAVTGSSSSSICRTLRVPAAMQMKQQQQGAPRLIGHWAMLGTGHADVMRVTTQCAWLKDSSAAQAQYAAMALRLRTAAAGGWVGPATGSCASTATGWASATQQDCSVQQQMVLPEIVLQVRRSALTKAGRGS
jgi:hypothetical protein